MNFWAAATGVISFAAVYMATVSSDVKVFPNSDLAQKPGRRRESSFVRRWKSQERVVWS